MISEATGTSVEDLVKLNHIEHPDVIFAGDDLDGVLRLPNQEPSKGSKNASQAASNQTRPIESGHSAQIRDNNHQEKADVSEDLKEVSEKEPAIDEPNPSLEKPVSSDQPGKVVVRNEKPILEDNDALLPKDKQALAKSAEENQTEMPIEIIKETEEESLLESQVLTSEEVTQEVGNIGQNGEELRSEPIGTVTKLTEELIESEENQVTTSLTTRKEVKNQPVRYLYDNSLEKSVEVIESEGQPAYDIIQTKIVANDLGQVLSRDEEVIESFPGHEKVIRLGTKEVKETSQIKELVQNKYIISHGREIRQTQDRYVGDDQILQVGQDGERVERLEIIRDASGQILSQTVLSSEVTKEAETEIVEKGSRENQGQVRNDEVT